MTKRKIILFSIFENNIHLINTLILFYNQPIINKLKYGFCKNKLLTKPIL